MMESSNNYRRRGRRTDVIGHISKHTRLRWKWHQDFRRTAKYVGIDSTCPKIIFSPDGRRVIRRRKRKFSDLYVVTTSRHQSHSKSERGESRHTVRQRTFISYKTLFPSDSRWEPRRKLFWNPRASTSPGMIRFPRGKISPWTGFLYTFARPKCIVRNFSRFCWRTRNRSDGMKNAVATLINNDKSKYSCNLIL